MANAKKCDRCGVFYQRDVARRITVYIDRHPYPQERLDLCDACTDELYKFLGYEKKEKKNG